MVEFLDGSVGDMALELCIIALPVDVCRVAWQIEEFLVGVGKAGLDDGLESQERVTCKIWVRSVNSRWNGLQIGASSGDHFTVQNVLGAVIVCTANLVTFRDRLDIELFNLLDFLLFGLVF